MIKNGNEKLVLAKIIDIETDIEYYINLKDINTDIRVAN